MSRNEASVQGHIIAEIINPDGSIADRVETDNAVSKAGTYIGLLSMFRSGEAVSQNFFGVPAAAANNSTSLTADSLLSWKLPFAASFFGITMFDDVLAVAADSPISPRELGAENILWDNTGEAPVRQELASQNPGKTIPRYELWKYERVPGTPNTVRLTTVWQRTLGSGIVKSVSFGNDQGMYGIGNVIARPNAITSGWAHKVFPEVVYATSQRRSVIIDFQNSINGTAGGPFNNYFRSISCWYSNATSNSFAADTVDTSTRVTTAVALNAMRNTCGFIGSAHANGNGLIVVTSLTQCPAITKVDSWRGYNFIGDLLS